MMRIMELEQGHTYDVLFLTGEFAGSRLAKVSRLGRVSLTIEVAWEVTPTMIAGSSTVHGCTSEDDGLFVGERGAFVVVAHA